MKRSLKIALIIGFLAPFAINLVSEIMYGIQEESTYNQSFYILNSVQILFYSLIFCFYSFVLRLCLISKVGIFVCLFLNIFDLISIIWKLGENFVTFYSIQINGIGVLITLIGEAYKRIK